jgi:hypothetical protein
MRALPVAILLASSTSFAWPIPNARFPDGANHHLGDASFVAAYGHEPGLRDREPDRMHAHLAYVHAWLASRPATRPELAERRAMILQHLADYVAKGTTPKNEHVPWRTPVFIDDHGTICAVGYLIQQTAGDELPKAIAAAHRYDYIEDIAKAMPEVAAWIDGSGFTLEEIASIQPAYQAPSVDAWLVWDLKRHHPDGPYDKNGWKGTFRRGRMEGPWTVTAEDHVLGRGTMHHGAGAWTSFYATGEKLAEGSFARSLADGPWKMYYPSGRLAAEGSFVRGQRDGMWTFYQDTAERTLLARGRFTGNWVDGIWKHYDGHGQLAEITRTETPGAWRMVDDGPGVDGGDGATLEEIAPKGEVQHAVHQGTVGGAWQRLDTYALGKERIYLHQAFGKETLYDADGFSLANTGDGWEAADCGWSAKRKRIARSGDIARLHGALYLDAMKRVGATGKDMSDEGHDDKGPSCRTAVAVTPARSAVLDALVAARAKVRAATPAQVRELVLAGVGEDGDDDSGSDAADRDARRQASADYAGLLASEMRMYIEWPHIDGKFLALFHTMPGRFEVPWYDRNQDSNAP